MTKILFTIDGGNTNLSVGIHSEHEELKVLSYNEFLKNLKEYAPLLNHSPAIYCSVRDYPEIDENIFPKLIKVPNFKGTMYLGMPINYSETIGKDRLVGSLYCFDKILNRKKNKIAFIDAGTFITVDFISHKVPRRWIYISWPRASEQKLFVWRTIKCTKYNSASKGSKTCQLNKRCNSLSLFDTHTIDCQDN